MVGSERGPGQSRGFWWALLVAPVFVGALVLGVTACTDLTASQLGTGSTGNPLLTASSVSTEATTVTAATESLSQDALAYAEKLGGTSHKGQKLYFVIGASVKTEAEAQALLGPAEAVGDMQSYFIVQLSDNFQGMTPGYYVVVEAYHSYPSDDNLQFDRRPFPDAYVKQATVLTDDPIPVYEEEVPPD